MDKALLAELEGLKQKDDETRQKLLREGRHYGHYEEEMQRVHIENTVSPGRIVSLYGPASPRWARRGVVLPGSSHNTRSALLSFNKVFFAL